MHIKRTIACLLFTIFAGIFSQPATALYEPPSLISQTAVLMDGLTGQVLYQKDMDKKMYPASITKIMTVLLAVENGSLNDTVTITDAVLSVPRDATHISLTPGEQVTLDQLIHAAFLESANDACVAIAIHISGSVEAFADLMNHRAKEAGAVNTHFSNPHGLFEQTHYTTARDMSLITLEALKNPEFLKVFTTLHYVMAPNNKQTEKRYFNTKLDFFKNTPYSYPQAIGGKNGWTSATDHTLVTAAEEKGRRLICVVLKSVRPEDKFIDTLALFRYGFDSFSPFTLEAEALTYQNFAVTGSNHVQSVVYKLPEDYTFLLHKKLSSDAVSATYTTTTGADGQSPSVMANIAIGQNFSYYMYPQIATVPLIEATAPLSAHQGENDQDIPPLSYLLQTGTRWASIGLRALGWLLGLIVFIILLLRLRRRLILNRRKRLKTKRLQKEWEIRRRQQLAQLQLSRQLQLSQKKRKK